MVDEAVAMARIEPEAIQPGMVFRDVSTWGKTRFPGRRREVRVEVVDGRHATCASYWRNVRGFRLLAWSRKTVLRLSALAGPGLERVE